MDEIIQVQDQYYIMASSARLNDRVRVLKHGDTFAVFDAKGDIKVIDYVVYKWDAKGNYVEINPKGS